MTTQSMSQGGRSTLLRRVLRSNGIFSGVSGAILIVGAGPLATLLGLNILSLLRMIGVVLLLYAAALFWVAGRTRVARRLALTAVVLDAMWVVGSVIVLLAYLAGWLPLSGAGTWVIALVAGVVAAFALLQLYALRQE